MTAAARRVGCATLLALAGCGGERLPEIEVFRPDYRGVELRLADGELVNLVARMAGARDGLDVDAYARCAAARHALDRGFGFARHVRTAVAERGGIWTADAVYTVTAALPRGVRTIDAEVVVADCRSRGIPTV